MNRSQVAHDFTNFLTTPATRRFMFVLAFVVALGDSSVWLLISWYKSIPLPELYSHWDSGWYTKIVEQGYDGNSWAFFPLYPALLRFVQTITGWILPTQIAGAILSSIIFLSFTWICSSKGLLDARNRIMVRPFSRGEWLMFMASPSAYVFHTSHTESLFLLLSVGAFIAVCFERPKWAAVFAGLCCLTRNQGVLVAIVVGIWATSIEKTNKRRLYAFVRSGLISAAFLAIFMGFLYFETEDPFKHLRSQQAWAHGEVGNFRAIIQSFWMGNPWQPLTLGGIIHQIYFYICIATTAYLWRLRDGKLAAIYVMLSLAIIPLQTEMVDVFRFSAVVLPLQFAWGRIYNRQNFAVQLIVGILLLGLSISVTYNYGILKWAY